MIEAVLTCLKNIRSCVSPIVKIRKTLYGLCLLSSERDVKGTNQLALPGALTEFFPPHRRVFQRFREK